MWTDASEEIITSIFRVENQPSKKPEYSRYLATQWTTRRYFPEDGNIITTVERTSNPGLHFFVNLTLTFYRTEYVSVTYKILQREEA
jgi:hypothetical protein